MEEHVKEFITSPYKWMMKLEFFYLKHFLFKNNKL